MTLRLATDGKCPMGIPEDLQLSPEVCYTGLLATNYTYVSSSPPGPWVGSRGTKIQISMPQELVSFSDSYLEFQITGSVGNTAGPPICSFVPDVRSVISRLTVQFASKTIIDIDAYGLLQNVFNLSFSPLWQNYNGSTLVASDSAIGNRQAYFLLPNKVYACRLGFAQGIESLFRKILPFQKLGSIMQIFIYLQDPQNVISSSIAITGSIPPSYTVNQVELHYITNVPNDKLDKDYDLSLRNPGITFTYRTFDYQLDTSTLASGITSCSKVMNYKYTSLLGFIMVMQQPSVVGNWTADNKMQQFVNPGVNKFYVRWGGVQLPVDAITQDADVFGRYLLMMGISDEFPVQASANWNYASSYPALASYVLCTPFAKYPNSIRSDGRIALGGLDSSVATAIQLELGFSVALPSALNLSIWAYFESTITINANGSVTLNQ
jgi:hypothetical protein